MNYSEKRSNEKIVAPLSRRKFLGYAGAATGLVVALAACSKDDTVPMDAVHSFH